MENEKIKKRTHIKRERDRKTDRQKVRQQKFIARKNKSRKQDK